MRSQSHFSSAFTLADCQLLLVDDVFPSCTSTVGRKEALYTTTQIIAQPEGRWDAFSVSILGRLGEPAAVRHRPEQSLFTGTSVFNSRSGDRSCREVVVEVGGWRRRRGASAPPPQPTSPTHVFSSSHHVQDVGVSGWGQFINAAGLKLGLYSPGLGKKRHDVNECRSRLIFDAHRCFSLPSFPNSPRDGTRCGQRHVFW